MKPIVTFVSSQIYVILWDPPHTMKQSTYISCAILERATYRRRLGSHQWRVSCDREKDCSDLDIQLPLQTINAELPSSGSNKWSHPTSTMNKVGMYETMRRRLAWVSHVYTRCVMSNLTLHKYPIQWWCTFPTTQLQTVARREWHVSWVCIVYAWLAAHNASMLFSHTHIACLYQVQTLSHVHT